MRQGSNWTATRLTLVIAGAVLLGGSGVAAATSEPQPRRPPVSAWRVIDIVPAPNQYNTTPTVSRGPAPERVRIPAIGVDAAVEAVGVTQDFAMATPEQPSNVGWYRLGSAPGAPGDAVIDGHLDTPTGAAAVFARLSQLKPGDPISVVAANQEFRFAVVSVKSLPYRWRPAGLYSTAGPPRLTLITCAGSWDARNGVYSERLVVEAIPSNN